MTQDQVLSTRGRADWISLNKPHPLQSIFEGRRSKEAPCDGKAPQIVQVPEHGLVGIWLRPVTTRIIARQRDSLKRGFKGFRVRCTGTGPVTRSPVEATTVGSSSS